jgi:DNA-binding response OmpR family regulator
MEIVIVDDEAVNLAMLKQLVGKLPDCDAQGFTQASAALAWCKANDPDLVILGYVMPEINGIKFTEQLRAFDGKADTPVLMVTANTDPEMRNAAFAAGINDFLNKPFDSAELQTRVSNMLVMRASQKKVHAKNATAVTEGVPQQIATLNAAAPARTKLLNLTMTLTRLSGDQTLFSDIARIFVKTAPQLLAGIRMAFSTNNMERVSDEAHSLKGAVAAFEAPEVYDAVASLQTQAMKGDTMAAMKAFDSAQTLVGYLVSELGAVAPRDQTA